MSYLNIYEAAKELNVSHTTIYNKLKNKEIYKTLKPFIKNVGNSKSISIEGIDILKSFINTKDNNLKQTPPNNDQTLNDSMFIPLQERVKQLEKDKDFLLNEINIKNELILAQSRQLENSQILLRDNQQKLLMLESKPTYKGFFKRLFKGQNS